MMEKKMETTIVYWGNIGIMDNTMLILGYIFVCAKLGM